MQSQTAALPTVYKNPEPLDLLQRGSKFVHRRPHCCCGCARQTSKHRKFARHARLFALLAVVNERFELMEVCLFLELFCVCKQRLPASFHFLRPLAPLCLSQSLCARTAVGAFSHTHTHTHGRQNSNQATRECIQMRGLFDLLEESDGVLLLDGLLVLACVCWTNASKQGLIISPSVSSHNPSGVAALFPDRPQCRGRRSQLTDGIPPIRTHTQLHETTIERTRPTLQLLYARWIIRRARSRAIRKSPHNSSRSGGRSTLAQPQQQHLRASTASITATATSPTTTTATTACTAE